MGVFWSFWDAWEKNWKPKEQCPVPKFFTFYTLNMSTYFILFQVLAFSLSYFVFTTDLSIHLVTANSSHFLYIMLFQMPQKMALHKKQYKILSAKLRLQSKKLGRFLVLLKKCPGRKLRRSVYYLCCCYYLFFHWV